MKRMIKDVSFQRSGDSIVRIHRPRLVRYLRYAPRAHVHPVDLGIKPAKFGF